LSIFPVDARGLDNVSITNGHLALTAMADETGGEAVLRSNNLAAGVARIVRDISSYYAIAYLAPSPYRSGTAHRITVRVNRPGVEVRTRNGYVLPENRPRAAAAAQPVRVNAISADLNAAINNPLPTAGLKLAVFAAPFRGKGRTSSVLVGVELDNLARAIELTTTGDREPLVAALGAAPATRREFSRDDELVVFAEVYDTDKTPHRTIVTTRVLDLTGRTALELIDPVPGISQGGRSEVRGHRARLRLSDLRPGRYLVQLEARSQTAPERIVTREIPFTVANP
jgi:hypothetical protein